MPSSTGLLQVPPRLARLPAHQARSSKTMPADGPRAAARVAIAGNLLGRPFAASGQPQVERGRYLRLDQEGGCSWRRCYAHDQSCRASPHRTKVIPHAFGERAILKLMFASLLRAERQLTVASS